MCGRGHDRKVETEVLAALIATPAVLATAGAAYFAGRAQARAALRAPVDSIRRTAQREAYAALLTTARTYLRTTRRNDAWRETMLSGETLLSGVVATLAAGVMPNLADAEQRRLAEQQRQIGRFRLQGDLEPMRHAVALVSLEGPEHLVPLAEAIEQRAEGFERVAQTMVNNSDTTPEERQEQRRVLDESYEQVVAAVPPFVVAARAYLNGDPTSR